MFKNCFKLKGFFIYTNEINEFDKEFEEYSHYSEENNEDNNSIVYRDLKDIDIYYNSTRSQRTENDEYVDNLTLLYFNENICECKYKYFYNLNQMFFNCYSLLSFANISKFNYNNIIDVNQMFSDCISLKSIPDISKWNTNKVTDLSRMFNNCYSLSSIPDISK